MSIRGCNLLLENFQLGLRKFSKISKLFFLPRICFRGFYEDNFFRTVTSNQAYRTPVTVWTPGGSTCVDTPEEILTSGHMCGHTCEWFHTCGHIYVLMCGQMCGYMCEPTCTSTPTCVSSCVDRSSGVDTSVGTYPQVWPHM